jgi:hypothetical protein
MSLCVLAAHSARQSETTTAGFTGFFEVGVGLPFLEIERKKEAHSTRISQKEKKRERAVLDEEGHV